VCRRVDVDGRGQARVLLRLVDEMLGELGAAPQELGAIVVGTGPGTFTGVRITVATARALSLALGTPVVGVSTLGALAAGAAEAIRAGSGLDAGSPKIIVPVVDARRGQVFFGLYEGTAEGRWTRSAGFGVCDRAALGEMVAGDALVVAEDRDLVGDLPAGVAFAVADVEAERLVVGQELLNEPGDMPEGSRLAPWLLHALAAPKSGGPGPVPPADGQAGRVGTPEAVKPIYVRSPDADLHITKMRDPWAESSGRRTGPGRR
jgi:tRNA threonylcarbamoyl adenosine modification protein YeaZ